MFDVLNPTLYRRLKRLFKEVHVSNAGQRMIARPTVNPLTGKPRLDMSQRGEQYRVCCDYCKETRFRLYISHMWGQPDAHGRPLLLAKCQNEDCLAHEDNQEDFKDRMEFGDGLLAEARVSPGKLLSDAPEVQWPGGVKPLHKLSADHKANLYLASRGFDPERLGKFYDVCYCEDSHYYLASSRIIIPVWDHGKLKGWQARYIGELPWKDPAKKRDLPPKYFSCPNSQFRSQCIYNLDRMREWQTGIIVEGPSDVWRFGPMAGCIFGNTMTEPQRRRFLALFRKHTAVLVLDPEEFDKPSTRDLVQALKRSMPGRFCAVKLPDGTDPGSTGREVLRAFVKAEAARQGVKVLYKKRDK